MQHIDLRLEAALKSYIDDVARRTGRTGSDVFRDLVLVGLGVQKEGGAKLVGIFGLPRPFAELHFLGKERQKVAFWVDEELLDELVAEFKDGPRGALRQALRLGALVCNPTIAIVEGKIIGFGRPLVAVDPDEIEDERARQALRRLRP